MIFSPSRTTTYLTCPMSLHLSRTLGWRPRRLEKRDAAAIVGQAFAAGIAVWNRVRGGKCLAYDTVPMGEVCAGIARDEAQRQIARLLAAGCAIPSPVAADFDFAPTIAARAVERVCADDPIPTDWTIVDVERAFEEHGNARPDLVCRDETGALVVVDYKCAMALKDAYVADRLDGYRRSWQMYHYVDAARTVYGEWEQHTPPCTREHARIVPADVTKYAIVLVRIEPWKVRLEPYTVDERLLARWRDAAWATWEAMGTPSVFGPVSNWTACDGSKFGPCRYKAACWEHGLDEALIALDYVKVSKEEGV